MTAHQAIETAIELRLNNKPISWVKLADKAGIHPEKLRGRVRRRLEKKKDHLELKKLARKAPTPRVRQKPYKGNPNNVLVIGDLHEPFSLKGYLEFCREQQEKWDCGTVVQIGDLIDGHAWSRFDSDPDGLSVGDELEECISRLKRLWKLFPEGYCTLGNHDTRIMSKAFSSGLSKRFLKEYSEIIEAPKGWQFALEFNIGGNLYTHGTGTSGQYAAFNRAKDSRRNTIMGHVHTSSFVRHASNGISDLWAMQVGCGVDDNTYAFEYGKVLPNRSVINCGVVLNHNTPILIPYV